MMTKEEQTEKVEFWRQQMEGFAASGLSVKAYYAQQGKDAQKPDLDSLDKSHGRRMRRRVFALPEACQLPELQTWPGLRNVLAVETIRQVNHSDETQCEIRYYLSSCADSVGVQAQAIRSHWGIENQLHWVLDMTFREDAAQIREKNSARSFAVMRKIALNLVREDKVNKGSLRGKRKKAGWTNDYMAQVLSGEFRA